MPLNTAHCTGAYKNCAGFTTGGIRRRVRAYNTINDQITATSGIGTTS